jgi:hypothetical protein
MVVIGGIPVHPLIVHAVVVLLPLAALGTVVLAARPVWRRTFGIPVLLIALVAVASVPVTTATGEQLQAALPPNPLIMQHAARGEMLLPFAVGYLVLLLATVVVDRTASATAGASAGAAHAATRSGQARGPSANPRSRIAGALAVLAAGAGIVVTGLVVWIGHAGATAVWQGVGQ